MTLILQGTDNSVSSPAVQGGTAGTTTGVYYPASNQLALATNGSLALVADASQNIGISKSAPVARLHLAGSGTSGQVTSSFIIENTSSGTMGIDITGSAGSSVARFRYGGGPGTGTNSMTGTFMTVGLEGGSAGTQGIYFAPTQVASSDANTLDDYEEGTWTPTVTFDSGPSSITYSSQVARYTKIGNTVNVWFYVQVNTVSGAGGSSYISGLPFTCNGTIQGGVNLNWANNGFVSTAAFAGHIPVNQARAYLVYLNGGATAQLPASQVTTSTQIIMAGSYQV